MGCGASSGGGGRGGGEVDEEVAARKRRIFRKGVDEEVAESLRTAVSTALEEYVRAKRASGAVVARTYESRVLGLRVSVQKRAENSRDRGGPRAKDWTSIFVEEVRDDEPRIRPTDELVVVNGDLIAIRDDDAMTDAERSAEFEKVVLSPGVSFARRRFTSVRA